MTYNGGYITVPEGGLYYIYAQIICDPDYDGWYGYEIRVNGISISSSYDGQGHGHEDATDKKTLAAGLLRRLNAGDRLSVTDTSPRNSSTVYDLHGTRSYFGAFRLLYTPGFM